MVVLKEVVTLQTVRAIESLSTIESPLHVFNLDDLVLELDAQSLELVEDGVVQLGRGGNVDARRQLDFFLQAGHSVIIIENC